MKVLKAFRTLAVFMAIVSLLFFAATTWLHWDIPESVMKIVQMVGGVFVALGILADTGKEPQPLSWQSILEKLKSPIGVNSLFALLAYIVYLRMAPGEADMFLNLVSTVLTAWFGFNVVNSMNVRDKVR